MGLWVVLIVVVALLIIIGALAKHCYRCCCMSEFHSSDEHIYIEDGSNHGDIIVDGGVDIVVDDPIDDYLYDVPGLDVEGNDF